MSEFETWLTKKLQDLNTDETVFLPYIVSILEGEDESQEEKNEGLTGLLSDILDNEAAIEKALNEILLKWKNCEKLSDNVAESDTAKIDITEKNGTLHCAAVRSRRDCAIAFKHKQNPVFINTYFLKISDKSCNL